MIIHDNIPAFQSIHDGSACHDVEPDVVLPSGESALIQKEYNIAGDDWYHVFLPDGRVLTAQGARPTDDEVAVALGKPKVKKAVEPVVAVKPAANEQPTPKPKTSGFKLPVATRTEVKVTPIVQPAVANAKPTLFPEDDFTPQAPVRTPQVQPEPVASENIETPTAGPKEAEIAKYEPVAEQPVIAENSGEEEKLRGDVASEKQEEPVVTSPLPRQTVVSSIADDDLEAVIKNLAVAMRWHQVHADWYRGLVGTGEDTKRYSLEARTHDKLAKAIKLARDIIAAK